jgi:hypothetical protein
MIHGADAWLQANRERLGAELGRLRRRLERYLRGSGEIAADREAGEDAAPTAGELENGAPAALDALCRVFDLSPFERDVVLLCSGVELDNGFAALVAEAQGDPRRTAPSFGLALTVLAEAHWGALAPVAPLRRWRLIEVGGGDTLSTSGLRIDERILHYLNGVSYLDGRLEGLIDTMTPVDALPPSQQRLAEQIVDAWANRAEGAAWPAVILIGVDRGGKQGICTTASRALGMMALRLQADQIPALAGERTALARLCDREWALSDTMLLVDCEDGANEELLRTRVVPFIDHLSGPLMLSAREPVSLPARPTLRLEVERPSQREQKLLWRDSLGAEVDGQLDEVVAQFRLGSDGIRAIATALTVQSKNGVESAQGLWEVCRTQARRNLDDLAQRIDALANWHELVLPEAQLQQLREMAVYVRHRTTVYDDWGFAAKSARGLGISALFAGPSGTGKTMAAEVLANELRLDLYRIDLSQAVSKYIGETEKNLRRIFDGAEDSGAILLFDEADALFGKRSEVKDSHDRYANIEVSYLLQRMETYRGLAILTTNMKDALDQGFLRRIRFVVPFPFPDAQLRGEIWRRVFPSETPVEGLDVERLARLQIAGGNIRNIALSAAFLAAGEGAAVGMPHVLHAVSSEFVKLERPLGGINLEEPT